MSYAVNCSWQVDVSTEYGRLVRNAHRRDGGQCIDGVEKESAGAVHLLDIGKRCILKSGSCLVCVRTSRLLLHLTPTLWSSAMDGSSNISMRSVRYSTRRSARRNPPISHGKSCGGYRAAVAVSSSSCSFQLWMKISLMCSHEAGREPCHDFKGGSRQGKIQDRSFNYTYLILLVSCLGFQRASATVPT